MYARQKKLLAHPLETAEESQLYITNSSPNTDIIFLEYDLLSSPHEKQSSAGRYLYIIVYIVRVYFKLFF